MKRYNFVSTFILIVFIINNSFGQDRCKYINFVLIIDDQVISPSSISNEMIFIKDTSESITDTIMFSHNVGTLTFDSVNYEKFLKLESNSTVILNFKYIITSPLFKEYSYQYQLSAKWLNYGFMIMKVYNFDNKKNRKEFKQRKGYGIEWQASDRYSIIGRK